MIVVDQLEAVVQSVAGALGKPDGKILHCKLTLLFYRPSKIDALFVFILPHWMVLFNCCKRHIHQTYLLNHHWSFNATLYVRRSNNSSKEQFIKSAILSAVSIVGLGFSEDIILLIIPNLLFIIYSILIIYVFTVFLPYLIVLSSTFYVLYCKCRIIELKNHIYVTVFFV